MSRKSRKSDVLFTLQDTVCCCIYKWLLWRLWAKVFVLVIIHVSETFYAHVWISKCDRKRPSMTCSYLLLKYPSNGTHQVKRFHLIVTSWSVSGFNCCQRHWLPLLSVLLSVLRTNNYKRPFISFCAKIGLIQMFIWKKTNKKNKILNLCIGGLTPSVGSIVTTSLWVSHSICSIQEQNKCFIFTSESLNHSLNRFVKKKH